MPSRLEHTVERTASRPIPIEAVRDSGDERTRTRFSTGDTRYPVGWETQVVSLTISVHLLERERDRLSEEIAGLEDEVRSLEDEIETLEETVERKDREIQGLVDRYEAIIAAKDRAYRTRVDGDTTRSERAKNDREATRSKRVDVIPWLRRVITR